MWNARMELLPRREKHKMNFCFVEFRSQRKKLKTYLHFNIFVNVLVSCFVKINIKISNSCFISRSGPFYFVDLEKVN